MKTSGPHRQSVLMIEDNPADARLLKELISEVENVPFVLEGASTLEEGLQRLNEEKEFSLILADLSLPDSQGLDTFSAVKAAAPQMPIIVMSGLDDEDLAIKTVQEGAQDYLVKGQVDSRLLVRSMHYAIELSAVGKAGRFGRLMSHEDMEWIVERINEHLRQCRESLPIESKA